jgi:hypothetical protein
MPLQIFPPRRGGHITPRYDRFSHITGQGADDDPKADPPSEAPGPKKRSPAFSTLEHETGLGPVELLPAAREKKGRHPQKNCLEKFIGRELAEGTML